MTPYQLDESANAPCTRTMVGLLGCAVAPAPARKRPTDVRIAVKIFILSLPVLQSAKNRVSGPSCDQGTRIHVHPGLVVFRSGRCRRFVCGGGDHWTPLSRKTLLATPWGFRWRG